MRTNRIIALISLSAVLLLTQCSSDRESRHSFKIEEIDGVITAVNAGVPKFSEELFRYEKVLELQQDENQPESLLQSSVTFTMGEDGYFYVEDNWSCRIAVFDSDGKYVRSIGREGSGPGEFSKYYWELRALRGDILDAYDSMLRRATRFRTDGALIEVVKFPDEIVEAAELQSIEGLIRSRQYLTPNRDWLIIGNIFEFEQDIRSTGVRFITISAEMERLGSAETLCIPNSCRFMMRTRSGAEAPTWQGMPYAPDPEGIYMPGRGILMTTGAEPTLQIYRLDGTIARNISLDLPPVQVTEEDKRAYIQFREKQIEGQRNEEIKQFIKSQLEDLKFPETKAYWTFISTDDAGCIWLGISESAGDREELGGYAYRLISPEGEYLGDTRAPYPGKAERRFYLVVVVDPETDERIPTVWRLIPAAEGFEYP